jgi:hypothetical protein
MCLLVQGRLDIGHIDPSFVVTHGGAFRSEIHRNAFDPRHLTDPCFHFVQAQYGQHVVDFDYARSHCVTFVGFNFNICYYLFGHFAKWPFR